MMVIINSILDLTLEVRSIVFTIWLIIFHLSFSTIAISYFYRYRILCLNKAFSRKLYFKCLLFLIILTVTYGMHNYYAYCIRNKNLLLHTETLEKFFEDKEEKSLAAAVGGGVSLLTF